jgi:hypothetical protein
MHTLQCHLPVPQGDLLCLDTNAVCQHNRRPFTKKYRIRVFNLPICRNSNNPLPTGFDNGWR